MDNDECLFDEKGLKPCEEQAMDCANCEYSAENATFKITEACLLYTILDEFGIKVGEWKPRLWNSIYEDFMQGLFKAGYIEKNTENDKEIY